MNSKILFKPGQLQQQPKRPNNREQQQSSGFGELQPRQLNASGLPASVVPRQSFLDRLRGVSLGQGR